MHPGYGFLAENPAFVEACVDNDLVFVGPPADVMATMGDKIAAKQAMRARRRADGAGHRRRDDASPRHGSAADEIGYPILLKASAGGGGKGMRLVQVADGARGRVRRRRGRGAGGVRRRHASTSRRRSSRPATSRSRCSATHYGNVLTLGERECSIQRRHQKLIEESPSAALTPEAREEMEAAAERACRAVGYRNAGTFEFLLGPDGSFYFIELNARLQVEHPVTELCTGIDLVREQLRVAAGERARRSTGRAPRRGHAIEIRLNAEDPELDFLPVARADRRASRPAQGPGVRVDTFLECGASIPPYYDSLVAKLVVWDSDRPAAIARAERALRETMIEGVPTTRDLALEVLGERAVPHAASTRPRRSRSCAR